jgi:leucyl-tRNA synthetase
MGVSLRSTSIIYLLLEETTPHIMEEIWEELMVAVVKVAVVVKSN